MPTTTLNILVKPNLNQVGLSEVLNENIHKIAGFIVAETVLPDELGTYTSGSFAILAVHGTGISYSMSYRFGWSAYHGCKDRDWADDEFGDARFTYRAGKITITVEKRPPARNPNEEF